jgi:hypothetical protein
MSGPYKNEFSSVADDLRGKKMFVSKEPKSPQEHLQEDRLREINKGDYSSLFNHTQTTYNEAGDSDKKNKKHDQNENLRGGNEDENDSKF